MTSVLLDSHILLWWVAGDSRLGTHARNRIDSAPHAMFSAASIWELEIKQSLGKIVLPEEFVTSLIEFGFKELPIRAEHAAAIGQVLLPHRDPFDRMLLTQAQMEKLAFVTADAVLITSEILNTVDARY